MKGDSPPSPVVELLGELVNSIALTPCRKSFDDRRTSVILRPSAISELKRKAFDGLFPSLRFEEGEAYMSTITVSMEALILCLQLKLSAERSCRRGYEIGRRRRGSEMRVSARAQQKGESRHKKWRRRRGKRGVLMTTMELELNF